MANSRMFSAVAPRPCSMSIAVFAVSGDSPAVRTCWPACGPGALLLKVFISAIHASWVKLVPELMQLLLGWRFCLADTISQADVPADGSAYFFQGDTWIERDQLHFAFRVAKIQERFIGNNKFWPAAGHAKLLARIAAAQVAGAGQEIQPVYKSALLQAHNHKDAPGIGGNF